MSCILSSSAHGKSTILFASNTRLKATLKFDVSKYKAEKENLREEGLPGVLHLQNETPLAVEVLSRGGGSIFNEMPPFKLKFKKSHTKRSVFKGIKKIKTVVPVDFEDVNSDKLILSQYLIYRLYEAYARLSYRTRLIELQIIDSSGKNFFTSRLMIFLEPNRNLSKRTGLAYTPFKGERGQEVDVLKGMTHLDHAHAVISFNFFIRNIDSAIPGMTATLGKNFGIPGPFPTEKNVKMFKDPSGMHYPVPYDFDIAGANDYSICAWEFLHMMLDEEQEEDGFEMEQKPLCEQSKVEFSLMRSYKSSVHKDKLLKHLPRYLKAVEQWRKLYKAELLQLSEHYIENFDMHLKALKNLRLQELSAR